MSTFAIITYFAVGIACALAGRILLRRLRIKVTRYWSVFLGEGTEAIVFTVFLWPITLLALMVVYLLQRWADQSHENFRALEEERRRKERENPFLALSLDQLLAKVDEQKRNSFRSEVQRDGSAGDGR